VTTSTMTFLWLITIKVALFLLLVGLTDHLTFAVAPNDGHPRLQIANMSDLFGEVGVRLTAHNKKIGNRNERVSLNEDGTTKHPRRPQKAKYMI
jgi:hypothetical protein